MTVAKYRDVVGLVSLVDELFLNGVSKKELNDAATPFHNCSRGRRARSVFNGVGSKQKRRNIKYVVFSVFPPISVRCFMLILSAGLSFVARCIKSKCTVWECFVPALIVTPTRLCR
jgi:hypothetical protein